MDENRHRRGHDDEENAVEARRLCMQGLQAMRSGEYEDAVRYLKQALDLDPERREIQIALVEALMENARFELAEKIARKALRRDPRSAALWYRLGYIHEVKDGGLAAEPYYRRALSMDENHSASLNSLASIYWRKGDRTTAARLLQKAAFADPQHPETKSNLQAVFGYKPKDGHRGTKTRENITSRQVQGSVIDLATVRKKKKH